MSINKHLVFAIVFALLNIAAIFFIFGLRVYGDTPEYLGTIKWFLGKGENMHLRRLVTPVGLWLAIPFEVFGSGAGLIIQNIIFYLLSAILVFKITELIYQNQRQALLASMFFITAVPALSNAISYLTDAGGWFFYLLSLFLTLLYFEGRKSRLIPLNGFLSGLGFLLKESGGFGVLFFLLMVLLSKDFKIKEKILKILGFGIFFFVPVLAWQAWTFKYFNFTVFHNYLIARPGSEGEALALIFLRYIGQLFIVMGILWPFILIGLKRELIEKNWQRIKIFLALLPSSFIFLAWSTWAGARTVFYFAPLGILLATYGLRERKLAIIALITASFIIFNYYFVWVNPKVAFIDKLYGIIF